MRPALLLPALLAFALAVHAMDISAEDEASFYMSPGEKASNAPLIVGSREYLLVLANAKPVALLERKGSGASAMDEPEKMEEVLAQYVRAGFPAVLLISGGGEPLGESLRTEMLSRIPSALRKRLVYVADAELRELRARRDSLYSEYNEFREVNFGALDSSLLALDDQLSQMRKSRSLEAAQRFSVNFEAGRSQALEKLDLLDEALADYSAASSALAAAARAMEAAKPRLGEESAAYQALSREALSVGYDLTTLEAALSSGQAPERYQYAAVERAAKALAARAGRSGQQSDSFFWQAAALVFASGLLVALALLARHWLSLPRQAAEKEGVGARILRRIRQFEDKVEREQRNR